MIATTIVVSFEHAIFSGKRYNDPLLANLRTLQKENSAITVLTDEDYTNARHISHALGGKGYHFGAVISYDTFRVKKDSPGYINEVMRQLGLQKQKTVHIDTHAQTLKDAREAKLHIIDPLEEDAIEKFLHLHNEVTQRSKLVIAPKTHHAKEYAVKTHILEFKPIGA